MTLYNPVVTDVKHGFLGLKPLHVPVVNVLILGDSKEKSPLVGIMNKVMGELCGVEDLDKNRFVKTEATVDADQIDDDFGPALDDIVKQTKEKDPTTEPYKIDRVKVTFSSGKSCNVYINPHKHIVTDQVDAEHESAKKRLQDLNDTYPLVKDAKKLEDLKAHVATGALDQNIYEQTEDTVIDSSFCSCIKNRGNTHQRYIYLRKDGAIIDWADNDVVIARRSGDQQPWTFEHLPALNPN